MLVNETALHILDPAKPDRRELISGSVVAAEAAGTVAEFPDARLSLRADQDILVFYEQRRKFMQQSARVLAAADGDAGPRFTLELVGDPVSAESREHYRVSTAAGEYYVAVDGREDCRMVDVSITGFAALTDKPHEVGEEIEASLSLDDRRWRGAMVIQSVRDLGRPGIRCGLRVRGGDSGGSLADGVRALALQAEREMLRRISGRD